MSALGLRNPARSLSLAEAGVVVGTFAVAPAAGSVLVEHLLDLVRLARPGQGQLQKNARLLRAQIVGGDEARLLPVVVAHDPPGADPGAAHDHHAGRIVELLEGLSRILGVAGAGAGDD